MKLLSGSLSVALFHTVCPQYGISFLSSVLDGNICEVTRISRPPCIASTPVLQTIKKIYLSPLCRLKKGVFECYGETLHSHLEYGLAKHLNIHVDLDPTAEAAARGDLH